MLTGSYEPDEYSKNKYSLFKIINTENEESFTIYLQFQVF